MSEKPKIIAVVGPTATGKSDLAVLLATLCAGEVISADSRQVYKGLDIGSGKITPLEMKGVPHHLLDVAEPSQVYSVSDFQRDGKRAIAEILQRHHTPIVVGGTGFYIDALLSDMTLPDVKPDTALRSALEQLSTSELHAKLSELDKNRSETIDAHNRVRLIRAIEVATHIGPTPPAITSSPYDILWIGIKGDLPTLKERIVLRLQKRIQEGMLEEFATLHKNGLSYARMEALGLEYRYGARLLQGLISQEEFVTQLSGEIFKYAKRQMTWFKRNRAIHWIEIGNSEAAIAHLKAQ